MKKQLLLLAGLLLFSAGCTENDKPREIMNELKTQKWVTIIDRAHPKLGKYSTEDVAFFKNNVIQYMTDEKLHKKEFGGAAGGNIDLTLANGKTYHLCFGKSHWQLYDRNNPDPNQLYGQAYEMEKKFYNEDHLQNIMALLFIRSIVQKGQKNGHMIFDFFDTETKRNLKLLYASINFDSPLNIRRLSFLFNTPFYGVAKFKNKYEGNEKFRQYVLGLSKDLLGRKNITYSELITIYYSLNSRDRFISPFVANNADKEKK